MRLRVTLVLGLSLLGCEARPSAPVGPRTLDKQAVFGDAGLVPTREGERARRELAIAGELARALTRLGFVDAHVDVELREPAAVIVIGEAPASAEAPEQLVFELSRALIPELERERLHAWLRPATAEDPAEPTDAGPPLWAVILAALGLGVSLGVLAERLRAATRSAVKSGVQHD